MNVSLALGLFLFSMQVNCIAGLLLKALFSFVMYKYAKKQVKTVFSFNRTTLIHTNRFANTVEN